MTWYLFNHQLEKIINSFFCWKILITETWTKQITTLNTSCTITTTKQQQLLHETDRGSTWSYWWQIMIESALQTRSGKFCLATIARALSWSTGKKWLKTPDDRSFTGMFWRWKLNKIKFSRKSTSLCWKDSDIVCTF